MLLTTTLLFLFVLNLLALTGLDMTLLAIKQTQHQTQFWQIRRHTMTINQQYAARLQHSTMPPCLVAYTPENQYWNATPPFWQTQTTACQTQHTQTVIEQFPMSSCQGGTHQAPSASLYYRITSYTHTPTGSQFLVQTTVGTCYNPQAQLSLGIQSWRMK